MEVLIVYSTVGGNTELVVKKVQSVLENSEIQVQLGRPENTNPEILQNYNLVILASPTYNQGTLEDNFKPFLKNWKTAAGQNFAVIGLGSTQYYPEYLTEAASILESEINTRSGQLFHSSLRIASDPLKILDSLVARWASAIVEKLNSTKL